MNTSGRQADGGRTNRFAGDRRILRRALPEKTAAPKSKNLRQGIAGGFGGLRLVRDQEAAHRIGWPPYEV